MRNLKTGAIQEKNFNASTKFDQANISKKAAQFSYEADNTFYFMDMETYDTYELSEEQVGYYKYFIVEGTEVYLVFFEGLLLNVSVSEKVELTIVETDPAIKEALLEFLNLLNKVKKSLFFQLMENTQEELNKALFYHG